jgi:hypothetical protein
MVADLHEMKTEKGRATKGGDRHHQRSSPPLFLSSAAQGCIPTDSSPDKMNRPGMPSARCRISGHIVNHRSISATATKSGSRTWYRWSLGLRWAPHGDS